MMEGNSAEEELLERRLREIETERQSILGRLKELKAPKKKPEASEKEVEPAVSEETTKEAQ